MQQLPLAMRLRERATFEAFVAGPNEATVAQLRALGEASRPRVCWLSGQSGVGKSHLLQACCARAASLGRRAIYLPLSQLAALGASALEEWQGGDLLALDELHTILGHADWERALFTLYRDAEERACSVVAAADRAPQELAFALPDLRSRFAAALQLSLQPLDETAQRSALQQRARARGLELPEETALYLQRRFRRELSVLYGLLDTLDEAALRAQRRLTVPFIRQVLAEQRAQREE